MNNSLIVGRRLSDPEGLLGLLLVADTPQDVPQDPTVSSLSRPCSTPQSLLASTRTEGQRHQHHPPDPASDGDPTDGVGLCSATGSSWKDQGALRLCPHEDVIPSGVL